MILAALLSLGAASASPSLDLDTLSNQADRVLVGKVLTTQTLRNNENAWTVATVRVSETLRGESAPVIDVRLPGAMLPEQDLTVHGQIQLITGHDVLLFLQGDQLVGMGAGAFVVSDDKAWHGTKHWTYGDPKTLTTDKDEYYVNHEMNEVRSTIR
jgi:hypothetical protein